MKNISILTSFIFSVILVGCATTVDREQEEQNQKAKYPIIAFVENFVAANPDFNNNDITRGKADEKFLESFISASDTINLISGIPVKLKAICEDDSSQNIYAQFRAWTVPQNFSYPKPIHEINFDIVVQVDKKYATTLNEESYYNIHGKFISRTTNLNVFLGDFKKPTTVYTPEFNIRKSYLFQDEYDVNLGMMYYEIDSISRFNQ